MTRENIPISLRVYVVFYIILILLNRIDYIVPNKEQSELVRESIPFVLKKHSYSKGGGELMFLFDFNQVYMNVTEHEFSRSKADCP